MVYKIFNNIVDVDEQLFFERVTSATRGHSYKIYPPRARLEVSKNCFHIRVVDPWNHLPDSVVSSPSLAVFK